MRGTADENKKCMILIDVKHWEIKLKHNNRRRFNGALNINWCLIFYTIV